MKQLAILAVLIFVRTNAGAQTFRLVSAASFSADPNLAPGMIVAAFGSNLTNTTASAPDAAHLPRSLGGVTLTVAGMASPLISVSPTQVNAQIDPSVPLGPATAVLTSSTGRFTAEVNIVPAAPGLFSMFGSGTRDGAIQHAMTYQMGAFSVKTGGAPTFLAVYATGLDTSETPKVTIGGLPVPVLYAGGTVVTGLQQINVQLTDGLAGAGRVEVAVESGGRKSNVVETVILPDKAVFASDKENTARSREIASLAYVPKKSLALLADENDDVVRVLDIKQRKVIHTIALPEGAQPAAIAVTGDAKLAVIAERNRASVAIVDLGSNAVVAEVKVESGPGSVAIAGNTAVVVNQDQDSVSFVDLTTHAVITVKVGRGPRGVAVDATKAYVTNEDDGTLSIIDLGSHAVTTLNLDPNSRPQSIQVANGFAVITEPSAGPDGQVILLNLASHQSSIIHVNPDRSGGSSDVAVLGSTAYFANQTGGSVTAAQISSSPAISAIKVDQGTRALAVDPDDNLLLVSSEGSGTVVLIDLTSNQVAGRIDGVRSEDAGHDSEDDDHGDREHAVNIPQITSVSPASGKAGTSVTLTVKGANLAGATGIVFVDPATIPGTGKGRGQGHGNAGDQTDGPFGSHDPGFTTGTISVDASGASLTVVVQIASGHPAGPRVVRAITPNGESTLIMSPANTFNVTQ